MRNLAAQRQARLRNLTVREVSEQYRLTVETMKPAQCERIIPHDELPVRFTLYEDSALESFLVENNLHFALDAYSNARKNETV